MKAKPLRLQKVLEKLQPYFCLSSFWLHRHFWSLVRLLYTTPTKARNSNNYILSLSSSLKVVTFSICCGEPKGTEEEKANSKPGKERKKEATWIQLNQYVLRDHCGIVLCQSCEGQRVSHKPSQSFSQNSLQLCFFKELVFDWECWPSVSMRVSLTVSSFCFPLDPNLCSIDLFFRHSFIPLKVVVVFSCAVKWMWLMELLM